MRTALSGPVILYGNDNPQQISETDSGPNADYQSNTLLDSRWVSQATAAGEGSQAGVPGWHNFVDIEALSAVPQAKSNTAITTSQTPAASAFFALNTTAGVAGNSPGIPLIPQGAPVGQLSQPNPIIPGSPNLVNVLALDFGFALVTTTTGATGNVLTVTGPSPSNYTGTATYATRFFYPGQRIIVAAAGNAAGTAALFTTVLATDRFAAPGQALAAAGTVVVSNPALFASTLLAVGTSDQEYGVSASPVVKAGAMRVWDPAQLVSRVVTVTSGSTTASGALTVRGYDIYGQPMSQQINIPTTASTNTGTKAFKYISSVQMNAGAVSTGGVSIGTADIIGLPMRCDAFEYAELYVNQVEILVPTNFVFADQTVPATNTVGGSGDVRGTYALQTAAGNTNRVFLEQYAPIATAKQATNIDLRAFVGVANA